MQRGGQVSFLQHTLHVFFQQDQALSAMENMYFSHFTQLELSCFLCSQYNLQITIYNVTISSIFSPPSLSVILLCDIARLFLSQMGVIIHSLDNLLTLFKETFMRYTTSNFMHFYHFHEPKPHDLDLHSE